ncbi:MAG: hypothetical protein JSR28_02110 [Proteobacteria bacterium]|nr:hypothetical protein [Pseudomonadota bacterium]
MKALWYATAISVLSGPALSQDRPLPVVVAQTSSWVLPQNTQVVLRLNEGLSTKSNRQKKGDSFELTVSRNVIFRDYIVVPRGTRAIGHISWQTRKGGFGKSGKMELAFDYILIGERQIPITGKHREEGEGNADATMGTFVFLSMLGSGLITGHSAEVPAGREFIAWTAEDVPIAPPAEASRVSGPLTQAVPTSSNGLTAIPTPGKLASDQRKADPTTSEFGNGSIKCITCRR